MITDDLHGTHLAWNVEMECLFIAEGEEAAKAGEPKSSNPFSHLPVHSTLWLKGWDSVAG